PSMRTLRPTCRNSLNAPALVAWAKATHSQLDQELGMLRVTVARLPTVEGTLTLVATVAALRSKKEMASPAILVATTAPSAILAAVTASVPILVLVTAPKIADGAVV